MSSARQLNELRLADTALLKGTGLNAGTVIYEQNSVIIRPSSYWPELVCAISRVCCARFKGIGD